MTDIDRAKTGDDALASWHDGHAELREKLGIPNDNDGKSEAVEPDREATPLETARNLALGMRDRVQQRLTSLRAQREQINDEIRELVEEEQRLTSMVRASQGRKGGRSE